MKEYLAAQGVSADELTNIRVKAYDGTVAEIGEAINEDGNVDILVGVGSNISEKGGVNCLDLDGDVTVGTKARYIARLTDSELVQNVYTWIKGTYGPESMG